MNKLIAAAVALVAVASAVVAAELRPTTPTYRPGALPNGTVLRAEGLRWNMTPSNTYPIVLDKGGANLSWYGGLVVGDIPADLPWGPAYARYGGDGFHVGSFWQANDQVPNFTLDGIRVHNAFDGIGTVKNTSNFLIRNVWVSNNRDDCVENDAMNAGRIEDSLFDGCFVGISARPGSGSSNSGAGKTLVLDRVLIRLQPMLGSDTQSTKLAHKGFFKWAKFTDTGGANLGLEIHNSVLMAEQAGELPPGNMGVPAALRGCSNNVMVWLGNGPFPGALPSCFSVTTDRSVWDKARADWLARHPEVARLPSEGQLPPPPPPTPADRAIKLLEEAIGLLKG